MAQKSKFKNPVSKIAAKFLAKILKNVGGVAILVSEI